MIWAKTCFKHIRKDIYAEWNVSLLEIIFKNLFKYLEEDIIHLGKF